MLKVIVGILLILVILLATGFVRTWQVQYDKRNAVFLQGTFPDPLPDGLYAGDIGKKVSWQGKKFNSATSEGINVFEGGKEQYPFATYKGSGLFEKNLEVLKIDYNIPSNPFWLKLILDEIVQVSPNQYLGKMSLQIIPGFPFSLGYFRLQK